MTMKALMLLMNEVVIIVNQNAFTLDRLSNFLFYKILGETPYTLHVPTPAQLSLGPRPALLKFPSSL